MLLDILHLLQRYEKGCIGKTDPLFGIFMRKLSNAIFMYNEASMSALVTWLRDVRKMPEDHIKRLPMSYFARRVIRHVPPPADLARRVQAVVAMFAELKTESGQYLFRQGLDGMDKVHSDAIQHILRGCVSDPPGEPMYIEISLDDHGRPTYISIRGSSRLEV